VNAELVLLYWHIGARIRHDVLRQARAEYGEEIVSTLSRQLTTSYGPGFSRQNLFHMIRFAEAWPDHEQVTRLATNVGWSHFKEVLYLENEMQRQFYSEMCQVERWSVRTLRDRVRSMLFERTAISRRPESVIRQHLRQLREAGEMTPELVFRDPYVLDFHCFCEFNSRTMAAMSSGLRRSMTRWTTCATTSWSAPVDSAAAATASTGISDSIVAAICSRIGAWNWGVVAAALA